jgi:hypothetical protein
MIKKERKKTMANYYPASVFHVREDITRENMRLHDLQEENARKKAEEMFPDFSRLPLLCRCSILSAICDGYSPESVRFINSIFTGTASADNAPEELDKREIGHYFKFADITRKNGARD